MSSGVPIGKLFRTEGCPTVLQWQIANFSTLSGESPRKYVSQGFFFMGKRWRLQICPNGDGEEEKEGFVGVYLHLEATKCPYKICATLGLKDEAGKTRYRDTFKHTFDTDDSYGIDYICERSELMSRRSHFLPADVLSVNCKLTVERRVSWFERWKTVSRNMKAILKEEKNSDVIFNLGGRSFKAHRAILGTGSKVFAAMFTHDMVENRTGEISIDDVEADVFEKVLTYMYSGEIDDLRADNVFELYKAADKYDLQELKELCTYFMEENMSVDRFCDVVALVDTYNEKDLMNLAKDFFNDNSSSILGSVTWERFVIKHGVIAAQLLTSIMKENVRRPSAKRLRCN